MELEEDPLEEQGDPIIVDAPCGVRFENVSYAYDDGKGNIIDNLSFDFRPGSCTAVLGETGAGKTTLVRLILSLLRPKKGRVVLYNSREAREMSPRMRANLVYVPQGNTLLSGTIRENLRLGRLDATDEEMKEALHRACADFVMELPDGLDTQCAEQGGGLSEGQAQRISIARAASPRPCRHAFRRSDIGSRPRDGAEPAEEYPRTARQNHHLHHPPPCCRRLLRPDTACRQDHRAQS